MLDTPNNRRSNDFTENGIYAVFHVFPLMKENVIVQSPLSGGSFWARALCLAPKKFGPSRLPKVFTQDILSIDEI